LILPFDKNAAGGKEQRAKSKEQRAKGQWAKRKGHRVKAIEQSRWQKLMPIAIGIGCRKNLWCHEPQAEWPKSNVLAGEFFPGAGIKSFCS
jgi:hypothetical protein